MLQNRMETISDKLLLLRDREKHDSGKEKSKSPIRAEDVSISSAALALTAKSPDVNSAAISSSGRNGNSNNGGYCPSSSLGSNCSSNNSSGGCGTKTKNIGVGANLNGHGRRGKMNGLHGQQHGGPRTVPVPAQQHSPIAGSLLPELMTQSSQSQLTAATTSRPGSVVPSSLMPLPGQTSTSPGLGTGKGADVTAGGGGAGATPSPNKIVSQNLNGTLAVTGVPTNESELQLYRVLQRANLLNYFDVMIELGGDDVQQLCDAGEEEFLEIMALVGMASKPLHVRRLQKSLQEWMTQPNLFQIPMLNPHLAAFGQHLPAATTSGLAVRDESNVVVSAAAPTSQLPLRPIPFHSGTPMIPGQFLNPTELMKNLQSKLCSLRGNPGGNETHESNSSSPVGNLVPTPVISLSSNSFTPGQIASGLSSVPGGSLNGGTSSSSSTASHLDQIIPSHFLEQRIRTRSEASSPASSTESHHQLDSRTSISPIPFLQEHEVQRLSEAAVTIISGLPASMMEPRLSAKKKMCAEFETVIRIPDNDPGKMEVVRKYAAIYGRHDCKRKIPKPLTLHELTVNEGAAQLCIRLPALLTRRDELFPLARQVVKEAGLPYAVGMTSTIPASMLPKTIRHDESVKNPLFNNNNNDNDSGNINGPYGGVPKRVKRDSKSGDIQDLRSSLSNDNESNSGDSYPNDSASNNNNNNHNRLGSSKRQEFFSPFDKSGSRSSSSGVLDMSSNNLDEPNDLSIGKSLNPNKCNLSSSSDVRNSLRNIKSEPVS